MFIKKFPQIALGLMLAGGVFAKGKTPTPPQVWMFDQDLHQMEELLEQDQITLDQLEEITSDDDKHRSTSEDLFAGEQVDWQDQERLLDQQLEELRLESPKRVEKRPPTPITKEVAQAPRKPKAPPAEQLQRVVHETLPAIHVTDSTQRLQGDLRPANIDDGLGSAPLFQP